MSKKIYFSEHNDSVGYNLNYWKEHMQENQLDNMVLVEGKRMLGSDYFYCTEYFEVGEVGHSCGKQCDGYKPNNGKNGRCKHYGYCYEETDIKITLSRIGEKSFKITPVAK